jgi:hypothetical protein
MSETPRTEEAKFSGIHAHPSEEYVSADFARELERDINEQAVANEASMNDQICAMAKDTMRLRKALQSLVDWGNTLPDIASDQQRAQYDADYAEALNALNPVSALPNVQAQR